MSDEDGWDDDPELRDRLRAADPASSLPPADPTRVARLLEDTMNSSTEDDVLTTESRETGTHGRSPLTWLVAAAAVVLIAGVALFGFLNHDSGGARYRRPVARRPSPSSGRPGRRPTRPAAWCPPPRRSPGRASPSTAP